MLLLDALQYLRRYLNRPNQYHEEIRDVEGFRAKPYWDNGAYSIGYGLHLDDTPDSRHIWRSGLIGSGVDHGLAEPAYHGARQGRGIITREMGDRMLDASIPVYLDRARELSPGFDDFSPYLKKKVLSSTYRGSWGDSPKARALVNDGHFRQASREFLNRDDYRTGPAGVRRRVRGTSRALHYEDLMRQLYGLLQ